MLETLKSLPDDADDLRDLVALMGEEIKSLTLKVEDLQGQLAAHRKARFGSKSESLDQLAFDLREDTEIARAAQAQHDKTGPDDDAAPPDMLAKRQHSRAARSPAVAPAPAFSRMCWSASIAITCHYTSSRRSARARNSTCIDRH